MTRDPPRVTFNPEETVISIRDDPTESKIALLINIMSLLCLFFIFVLKG